MGQHIIVEKLNRELAEPITSERQVVYILVETRKLLELMGMLETYPQLTFFCNWAMHPTLDREPARRIIRLFDSTVVATRTSLPTLADIKANANAMQEHLGQICGPFEIAGFGVFKEELEKFFDRQGIDCPLLQDQKKWIRFLGYYSSVVEDCPLKCQDDSTAHVETLLVRKLAADSCSTDTQAYLYLQWSWVHDDGTETPIVNSTLVYPPSLDEG